MKSNKKIFISHASEDKEEIARPLAEALKGLGIDVWLDEFALTLGDSLLRSIDKGLAECQYGLVILSPAFFRKAWPQRELAGLAQKEQDGHKVILPVWHGVERDQVAQYSPTLSDRIAAKTSDGIEHVVQEVVRAIKADANTKESIVTSSSSPTPVAFVDVTYVKLLEDSQQARYSLVVAVTLNSPPDQGRMRLKLQWPALVDLYTHVGLQLTGRKVDNGTIIYREYQVDWEKRTYCGEQVIIVGGPSSNTFEYIINDLTWAELERCPLEVSYTLYLEDHPPVLGSLPMRKLHDF